MSTALERVEVPDVTAVRAFAPLGPITKDEWTMTAQICNLIASTEFVPKAIRGNKPAIMAAVLYGRDRGIGVMTSLSEISVIDGTPSLSTSLMLAMARAHGNKLWRTEHRNDNGELTAVTAHARRPDGTEDSFTYTTDMAAEAGLLGKSNWKKHKEQMLSWRAYSAICRLHLSDAFQGPVFTTDEIEEGEFDAPSIQALALEDAPEAASAGGDISPGSRTAEGHGGTPDGAEEGLPDADGGGRPASPSSSATAWTFPKGVKKGKTLDEVADSDPAYLLMWKSREDTAETDTRNRVLDYLAEHDVRVETPAAEGEQTELVP